MTVAPGDGDVAKEYAAAADDPVDVDDSGVESVAQALPISTADAVAQEQPDTWTRVVVVMACVAGWLVPGAGHFVAGRFARGAALGVLVIGLFVGGMAMRGKVYRPVAEEPLTVLAAVGASGVGLPFLLAHAAERSDGDPAAPLHEYGNTFTLVAGLLNLLILLDAYDVAAGRR